MDIAIIGIAGYFSDAPNVKVFHDLLKNGTDCINQVSNERIFQTGISHNRSYQVGAFLKDIDKFDHEFFEISLGEAKHMDPQQRLLLEVVYHAIENAGYDPVKLRGSRTAVFAGDVSLKYHQLIKDVNPTTFTGNLNAMITGRISRFFDFRGSSLVIDTACSSSLVALHYATRELKNGEADYGLVCAANIDLLPPEKNNNSDIGIMSPDGRSKTFSNDANGTSNGEIIGAILLKPLSKAIHDKDTIHAVIKGSAVNQDANISGSLTAPSAAAQADVICRAWKDAAIDPLTITYVEAHGTGTKLGDPIEIEGLNMAFSQFSDKRNFCAVSSVKTNIGHTDTAAGLAGVFKGVLSLKHRQLFPSLHFTKPNELIDFNNSAVYVNTTLKEWKSDGTPLRCGISSFGLSGTNCHLVLEEAPKSEESTLSKTKPHLPLIPISAKDFYALQQKLKSLYDFLIDNPDMDFQRMVYTLQTGRQHFNFRWSSICLSIEELVQHIDNQRFNTITSDYTITVESVLVLSDNINPNPDFIKYLRSSFPQFNDAYTEVQLKMRNQNSKHHFKIYFLYGFYKLISSFCLNIKKVTATGIGRIAIDLIFGNISQVEAEKRINEYQPDGSNSAERVNRLIKKLKTPVKLLFIDHRSSEEISAIFEKMQSEALDIKIIFLEEQNEMGFLNYLQDIYLANFPVDWEKLNAQKLNRVELPNYNFNQIRCWVDTDDTAYDSEVASSKNWLFKLQWEEDTEVLHHFSGTRKKYVIFLDNHNVGKNVIENTIEDFEWIIVNQGKGYVKLNNNNFTFDWISESHYRQFRDDLSSKVINGIFYFGSCNAGTFDFNTSSLHYSLYAPFLIAKYLIGNNAQDFDFTLVTNRGRFLEGIDQDIIPSHSASHGFQSSLYSEFKGTRAKCIDVNLENGLLQVVNSIVREIKLPFKKLSIAYRNNKRFIPMIGNANMDKSVLSARVLRLRGTYIITGGTSGIGQEIARYIGKNYQANLIILGRRLLPDKKNWESYKDEANYSIVETFKEIENSGGSVSYYSVDLANEEKVKSTFDQIKKTYEYIHGVIHSAGLPGKRRIQQHDIASFEETLTPKIHGTVNLYKNLHSYTFDFFVLFSSINAIIGSEGGSNYSAANSFQDSFAYFLRSRSVKAISINWPGWAETGMLKRYLQNNTVIDKSDLLSNREGIETFISILKSGLPQVIVSKVKPSDSDNPYFLIPETWHISDLSVVAEPPKGQQSKVSPLKNSNDLLILNPTWTNYENTVGSIWTEVLKASNINLDDDYFDLGGHSLNGVQVINRLREIYDIPLEFEEIFELSTIQKLATHIQQLTEGKTEDREVLSIANIEEQDYYACTPAQRRFWVIHHLENNASYNLPISYTIEGDLDQNAFIKAVSKIFERHESLRTVFPDVNGNPKQRVIPTSDFQIDFANIDAAHFESEEIDNIIHKEPYQTFDLVTGPLVRIRLFRFAVNKNILLVTFHHIIADGWSIENVFLRELYYFYGLFSDENSEDSYPDLKIQYKDYTAWLQNSLSSDEKLASLKFFKDKFSGKLPVLELPLDFPRPPVKLFNNAFHHYKLKEELSERITQFSHAHGVSLFTTLLTGVKVLLKKYSRQNDIIVGSPFGGRDHISLENQIGLFLNNLAIRTKFDEGDTFETITKKISQTLKQSFEHRQYPFDDLVDELNLNRDMSRSALFDVLVVSTNFGMLSDTVKVSHSESEKLSTTPFNAGDFSANKYDLTIYLNQDASGFSVSISYSKNLFMKERIERMTLHYENLLSLLLRNPNSLVDIHDYITTNEKEFILNHFNNTKKGYDQSQTLPLLFEETANKFPDAIAIKKEDLHYTYCELSNMSNQIAQLLIEKGVSPGKGVGIITGRNVYMIASMLAIMKVGAFYIPIDPRYPLERQKYIVEKTNARTVLLDSKYEVAQNFSQHVSIISIGNGEYKKCDNIMIDHAIDCRALAYTIFTSGSTGTPKGVMIPHCAVTNLIQWVNTTFNVNRKDKLLFLTSMCFDLSVYDIFGILSAGGMLVITEEEDITRFEALKEIMLLESITFWDSVPSTMNYLVSELEQLNYSYLQQSLRLVFLSGDWIPVNLPERMKKFFPYAQPISLGGATEATVWSNYYPIKELNPNWKSIPYGRPIWNNRFYMLDSALNLVPNGVIGEIYIGGVGVAKGYINDESKTASSFTRDPFTTEMENPYMYKTGDLGRMMADGNMEFLGREDHQVKIRGFRIECGEIEFVLSKHPAVESCLVLARKIKDNHVLIGYYTGKNTSHFELSNHLSHHLPNYMIPSFFINISSFTLNINGKIDRSALPDPIGLSQIKQLFKEPKNKIQQTISDYWKQILGVEKLGVNDNFFDLGGHSLNVSQLRARIGSHFNVNIPLVQLFLKPTVEGHATLVKGLLAEKPQSTYMYNKTTEEFQRIVSLNISTYCNPWVVFFPSIIGSPYIYKGLISNYLLDYNCFGINYRTTISDNTLDTSIDEIVTDSVNKILHTISTDQIVIIGYSMGCLVAFEVAQKLEHCRKVNGILLIDRPIGPNNKGIRITENEATEFIKNEFSQWPNFYEGFDSTTMQHYLRVSSAHKLSSSINCPIVALESNLRKPLKMKQWKKRTSGTFTHLVFDGDHHDAIKQPTLPIIAKVVKQLI